MKPDPLHSLLRRQLKRAFGADFRVPEPWQELVAAVDAAYRAADVDREMLERSLDLSSQELLQAGAEMRAVLQALPDLLIRLDANGALLDARAGADSAVRPRAAAAHVGPEFRAAAARVAATGVLQAIEYALPHDGGQRHYEARLAPLAEGQVVAFVRDITQRKHAEAELQRTISLLRSTLDSTADGILVVDRAGRIVSFNQRFVAMWGIPPEVIAQHDDEAALRHVLDQLKDPKAFLRRVRELYADPEAESFDTIEFKDGRVFERYSCPQRLESAPIGRAWSFRDVSERRQLEQQFLQAQKMDAVGRLAGGVAHDFNNLLTVILSSLSLLRLKDFEPAREAETIDDCMKAAQRAAELTGQLLTFSRRRPVQRRDVSLNEILAGATKMFQRVIGEHITLLTEFAPGEARVRADPGMIEQTVMNLVVNSRDAMPRGGRLTLATALVELGAADLAAHPRARPGEFVELTVSDTGAGIDPEVLPHVFEPFFTTKDPGKGTGLGLATVFGIVEQHDGWIEVESVPGLGTRMRLFFPRSEAAALPAAPCVAPPPRRGTETILLVEDESAVRSVMRTALERHGYRVLVAVSAEDAFRLWRERRDDIALLVTDVVMPGGVNGRELAELLRVERPALRVVYCSGYTDEALGENSPLRANPFFLEKPFEVNVLLERVRACLDAS